MNTRLMAVLLISVVALSLNASVVTRTPDTTAISVLSFKEWRNDKQSSVRAKYAKLQVEYVNKKNQNPKDASLKGMYADLKNTKAHLDEIAELTVSDYFVGYLSQTKDQKKSFQAAAAKLDSDEVAELMSAYAESLLKTTGEGISTSPRHIPSEASK